MQSSSRMHEEGSFRSSLWRWRGGRWGSLVLATAGGRGAADASGAVGGHAGRALRGTLEGTHRRALQQRPLTSKVVKNGWVRLLEGSCSMPSSVHCLHSGNAKCQIMWHDA